jgi:hypothetical protein
MRICGDICYLSFNDGFVHLGVSLYRRGRWRYTGCRKRSDMCIRGAASEKDKGPKKYKDAWNRIAA